MRLSPTKLETDLTEKAEKSAQMQAGSIYSKTPLTKLKM